MARVAWSLAVPAAWLVCLSTAFGQEQPVRNITAVEFTGLTQANEVFVRDLVGVRIGQPLDPPLLDEAVVRLLRSGRFLSARYVLTDDDPGAVVTFELRERPVVTAIRFEGNSHFRDGQFKTHVTQAIGEPVDWFAIRDARDAIVAKYRDAGFGDIQVGYDTEGVTRSGELVFTIEEGLLVRIREISFEGNEAFDEGTLKRQVDTKTAMWIFRSGSFDEDRAEADVAQLQTFYRDEGYLDARVSYRRELSDDGEDLTVVFTIEEGARYSIEAIEFRGNSVLKENELSQLMNSQVGQTVSRLKIAADVRAIQKRYGELGHIYVAVQPSRVFSARPGLVRITIDIAEGEQYRVGRVVVRGNARTRDKVVRRALNLYPPDDLFDMTEVQEAQRRLKESRIFDSARVYPVGNQPGVRDIVMDVQEAEKAGDFIFGVGVTSNAGLVGNVVLDLQNFDISDRPRSLQELLKLRAFFGGGQHFRLEVQPGTELSRFRLDFTEPYWMDKPLRLDVSAFLFQRARNSYDERRGGVTFSLGRRFERGRLRGWSGELALRAEQVSLRELDLFAAREIREEEGSAVQTSLKVSLVRDGTDNRFIPTSGSRLRLAYEQFGVFGGEHMFGRLTAGYTWYKTLDTDLQDRKHVLKLRAEGGAMIGDAPVHERFYAGGTGSIRGFEFRGVGRRSGLNTDNIGGDYMLLGGAEYAFPLVGENIRGFYFLDTGWVGTSDVRASIGAGARFTIDVFGPVPLELGLGFPLTSQSDDETQVFSFLVGRIF